MLTTDVHNHNNKHRIMRDRLCDAEYEILQWGNVYEFLMDGCQGYNNMSNEEIESLYETHFDEPFEST